MIHCGYTSSHTQQSTKSQGSLLVNYPCLSVKKYRTPTDTWTRRLAASKQARQQSARHIRMESYRFSPETPPTNRRLEALRLINRS